MGRRNEEEERLEALHHPFTAPRTQDIADGGDIRTALAQAYDLVLNGTEVGGWSGCTAMSEMYSSIRD